MTHRDAPSSPKDAESAPAPIVEAGSAHFGGSIHRVAKVDIIAMSSCSRLWQCSRNRPR